eukprot:7385531-Prymnesium_polylepis.1
MAVDAYKSPAKWTTDCKDKLMDVVTANGFSKIRRNVVAVARVECVQPLSTGTDAMRCEKWAGVHGQNL